MKKFILLLVFLIIFIPSVLACRLWASYGSPGEDIFQSHLVDAPDSLQQLSSGYRNGWGFVAYTDTYLFEKRGLLAADEDTRYQEAVTSLANASPSIAITHIRACSSGCCDIQDPHPFTRPFQGKTWSFAHNGHIQKNVLRSLIGDFHLERNPIQICPENPIDTELYFIYVLKMIDQSHSAEHGIYQATTKIIEKISGDREQINFIMSDGETLWAYRRGPSLYYSYSPLYQTTLVASQPPDDPLPGYDEWENLPQSALLIVKAEELPQVYNLEQGTLPEAYIAPPILPPPADHAKDNGKFLFVALIILVLLMFGGMLYYLWHHHKKSKI